MSEPSFITQALAAHHERSSFTCGVEALDRYLREQATQDIRRRVANCFVMVDEKMSSIAGYYALSATSLLLSDLPQAATKRLPRYPQVPAVILGRLAVAIDYQGRHVGAALLADATERAARADIAVFAIITDPIDERAHRFYKKHGFMELSGERPRLFIPIESIRRLLKLP